MKLELQDKCHNLKEYVCELTKELDKLARIDKKEYYYIYHHYILRDKWYDNRNCLAIRIPGGTLGVIYYDDDFKITELQVDTNYVIKTYPKNVNEIIQKYIGQKIDWSNEDEQ